jgi:hypothetical protein
MANVMEFDETQIDAWVADPATLPHGIETKLRVIGEERTGEIQAFLDLMKETGVNREHNIDG